ncbi:MAG: hypothetical protein LBV21_00595 [Candidatus Adiutrix sp.]|jgi:trimethylamine--corrinoid protein Co-methyltransferase|nr:hypothetical protein [Candidatus Adiutrix sp.]
MPGWRLKMAALAGVNIIYGLGMLETGVTFSAAQPMIDADIAKLILHAVTGEHRGG